MPSTVRILSGPTGKLREQVPGVPFVGQTISASPKGTGTLEAEGKESIVGDLNRDGMIEHMRVVGPSHAAGGVELDVDPGSFVFSNSKKLRIKDPATLDRFTSPKSKKGKTPAEVAKQYDLNTYVQILKDPDASVIAKETAQLMLDSNTKKLAELALEQELMKGLPNGIPAISQQILSPEILDQVTQGDNAEIPEYAFGGELPLMQAGGDPGFVVAGSNKELPKEHAGSRAAGKNAAPPRKGDTLFMNDKPVKIVSVDSQQLINFPTAGFITLSNGQQLTIKDWNKIQAGEPLMKTGVAPGARPDYDKNQDSNWGNTVGSHSDARPVAYSIRPVELQRKFGGVQLKKGDKMHYVGSDYEILDPHGEFDQDYAYSGKRVLDMFDDTKGIIKVRNLQTKKIEFLEGEDVIKAQSFGESYLRVTPRGQGQVAPPARKSAPTPVTTPPVQQAAPAQNEVTPDVSGWGDTPVAQVEWPEDKWQRDSSKTQHRNPPPKVVHTRPRIQGKPAPTPTQAERRATNTPQQTTVDPELQAYFDSL